MYGEILHDLAGRWSRAATSWQPEELAALYTNDAIFFGGRQTHSVGRAQILEYFRSYSGELKSVQLGLAEQEIREISPMAFASQGYGDATFQFSDGRRTKNRIRTSWVLVLRDGEWRIVMHHFSPTPEVPPFGN